MNPIKEHPEEKGLQIKRREFPALKCPEVALSPLLHIRQWGIPFQISARLCRPKRSNNYVPIVLILSPRHTHIGRLVFLQHLLWWSSTVSTVQLLLKLVVLWNFGKKIFTLCVFFFFCQIKFYVLSQINFIKNKLLFYFIFSIF